MIYEYGVGRGITGHCCRGGGRAGVAGLFLDLEQGVQSAGQGQGCRLQLFVVKGCSEGGRGGNHFVNTS